MYPSTFCLKVFLKTQRLCFWRWYYFYCALLMDYTLERFAAKKIQETHNWLWRVRERTAIEQQRMLIREQDLWMEEHLTGHLAPPSTGIPFPTSSQINWPAPGPGRLISIPAALHAIRLHNAEVCHQYLAAKHGHLQRRLLRKTIRAGYRKWKRRLIYC